MTDYLEHLYGVKDKIALVTGGATGIGRMMAEALVRAGARVMICSRKAEHCAAVADELNKLGGLGSADSFGADLGSEIGVKAVAREVKARTNVLHILANNAGATWGADYETFPRAAWDKVMNLNVTSIFELTRDLSPLLEAAASDMDPARVINIASVMGIMPVADGCYSYSASKAAVIHLTKILANELTSKRITVNAFAPGPFPSKMTAFATASQAGAAATGAKNPMGRIGRRDDIAAATLFLCGYGGSYVTGTIIPLDGGYVTHTSDGSPFPKEGRQ